ncbi:MAG: hypothetical protein PWP03_211 [Candidatus Woesearchaeota archaeon]|nr:hypothetical protein [Candidatus Woesearchaeota archaeon]
MNKIHLKIILGILLISMFAISFLSYKFLPEQITTHWDEKGLPNGNMPKLLGLFLIPLISLALTFLFLFLPQIDPLKENILKFENSYHGFIILFISFMFIIQTHLILWNLGFKINPLLFVLAFIITLFYYIGVLCEKSKRNWFIGIRNPWTLSSDFVWNKTNKLAGKFFKVSSILFLLCVFFPRILFYLILIDIAIIIASTFVYSYKLYQKTNRKKES